MKPLADAGPLGRRLHRTLLPLHHAGQRRLHDLQYLFFELTQRCNLACRHCGSDCAAHVGVPDLPAADVLRVLEAVRQRHDPARITVAVTGGEPLLHPGLFSLGRAITELGFPWGLVTNGWAWSPAVLEEARGAGLRTATVSLDGLPGAHDWLRGRTGSHARAVATLRLFAGADWLQTWDVVTCVHRRNLDELDAIRALLGSLGVPRWRLFTVSPIGRAAGAPELSLDRDDFRRLLSWIETARATPGVPVSYSESGYLGSCDRTVRSHPFFCRAGINVAGIMVDGTILACPNIDRRFGQGNISRDDFCQVWEHGYREFRDRGWMRTGQCRSCSEWHLCQGNSFHLWDRDAQRTRLCHHREFGLDDHPA